jgi:hypothetical protein
MQCRRCRTSFERPIGCMICLDCMCTVARYRRIRRDGHDANHMAGNCRCGDRRLGAPTGPQRAGSGA